MVADTGNLSGLFLDFQAGFGEHTVLRNVAGVAVHVVDLLEREDGELRVAGKDGGEVADVELLVGGLSHDAVALLCHGERTTGNDIACQRDVLESERAGRLLTVVDEVLHLRRVVHLVESLVELADEIEANAALLHLFEGVGQALDLSDEFLVLLGERCKGYTVLGRERLEGLFEGGGVNETVNRLVDSIGESTEERVDELLLFVGETGGLYAYNLLNFFDC